MYQNEDGQYSEIIKFNLESKNFLQKSLNLSQSQAQNLDPVLKYCGMWMHKNVLLVQYEETADMIKIIDIDEK